MRSWLLEGRYSNWEDALMAVGRKVQAKETHTHSAFKSNDASILDMHEMYCMRKDPTITDIILRLSWSTIVVAASFPGEENVAWE